ncbi:hypothetical protein ACEPAI_1789 [Sanghuangporus weigelae]
MSSGNTTISSTGGPLGVSYQLLVGPLLIGVVVNALVFGVCVMQLVSYLMSGYRDGWRVISLLGWIYAIDTFQVCSSVSMLWHYVVDNFANPVALAFSPWEYATLPIFSSLASVPIQHFMAFRIMRFSGSKLLFAFISFLSWAQAALAITSAIQGVIHTSIESHKKIIPYADAWLALSACCDASITVFLLYYLLRSRTGFERTDSIISTICTTTVKAAVPVTVLCILDLCFLTTTPNNNLHYMFALPVGRLLTNTLMSVRISFSLRIWMREIDITLRLLAQTLNERKHLRSQMENSTPNRGFSLSALTTSKHRFQMHPAQVRINIERDTDGGVGVGGGGDLNLNLSNVPSSYARRASAVGTSPISPVPSYYSPTSPTNRGRGVGWGRGPIESVRVDREEGEEEEGDVKYVVDDFRGVEKESVEDPEDSKASPIVESPSSVDQRVVLANLPRIPAASPVPGHRGDEERGEEGREEVGGVRFERVGYGF